MKLLKDNYIDRYVGMMNDKNSAFSKAYSDKKSSLPEKYKKYFTLDDLEYEFMDTIKLKGTMPDLSTLVSSGDDFQCSKMIFEWLKELNIGDANDRRLWTTLTHIHFWGYTRLRWSIKKSTEINVIKTRYFYEGSSLQARLRNSISRLWWVAKLTYDEKLENPYEYTEIVWSSQDLMQNLFERSFGTYPNIRQAILKFYKDKKGIYNDKQMRVFYTELNALGSSKALGLMSTDEVLDFFTDVEQYRLETGFEDKKRVLLKLVQKQDIGKEIFIPKKYIGENKFFCDPRKEDPNPISKKPHTVKIHLKWKGQDSEFRDYEFKNFIKKHHSNADTRIAGTPQKELNNIILFIKEGDKHYQVETISELNDKYSEYKSALETDTYLECDFINSEGDLIVLHY